MKYRSKTDIIGHILEALVSSHSGDSGLTKMKIMYNVFLSYAQLQKYLLILVEKELIEQYQKQLKADDKAKQQQSHYYYRITGKGKHFLQIYRDLSKMIA
jgi:predicted transcriptional regulator